MALRSNLVVTAFGALCVAGCVQAEPDWRSSTEWREPHGPIRLTSAANSLERVTVAPEDELFQDVSPDGRSLLHMSGWLQHDHSVSSPSLMLLDLRSSEPSERLVGADVPIATPAWLPNGSSFVFATHTSGTGSIVSASISRPGELETVVDGETASMPLRPRVSPDGSRIAFSFTFGDRRKVGIMEIPGTELEVLGEGDYPRWSPDGRQIVFERYDASGYGAHVLLSEAQAGATPAQLTSGTDAHIHPAFDPSGEYIVFGSTRGADSRICTVCCNLYVMKRDGTEVTQLVEGDVDADWPTWASDGWIYFASNQEGHYDIWRLRPSLPSLLPPNHEPATPTRP